MADKVGSNVTKPCTTGRQMHRSNASANDPCEYYKRNVAIPLLDHIISELEQQFSNPSTLATSLLWLVLSALASRKVTLDPILTQYEGDLPSPELLEMELRCYKQVCSEMPTERRPSSPATAIKDCDRASFPNIWTHFCRLRACRWSHHANARGVQALCED